MKKLLFFAFIIIITTIALIFTFPKQPAEKNLSLLSTPMPPSIPKIIREPAVAGQFYPADKDELSVILDNYLTAATTTPLINQPQILIVPHAGYVFSGATAAHAYKTLQNFNYDTVIILGSSHHYPLDNLVLYNGDAIKTPLGIIPVNKKLISSIISANPLITVDNDIHIPEHSLEVQLPFLQKILDTDWQVIFGLINSEDNTTLVSLAETLSPFITQSKVLLVISSDLSHYPSYNDAIEIDEQTIKSILTKNINTFDKMTDSLMSKTYANLDTCACGSSAIKIGMLLAKQLNLSNALLKYSNSGDIKIYGDKNRVVGYGALVFSNRNDESLLPSLRDKGVEYLKSEEQSAALALARNTLELEFNLTKNQFTDYQNFPIFNEKRGVFVTLRKKGELHGCIGLIEPITTLSNGIIEMSKAAAFNDSRFDPLTKDELNNIKIEISVLTPPQKISDPSSEIKLGTHGVIVRAKNQPSRSGVFLPQVAEDTGWNLTEFMSHLCADKAGLPADCWLDGSSDIYTFEAQVFEE